MKRFAIVLITALLSIPALAQQVEVTPFFGYRSGGEFQADAINPFGDVEIDDSDAYGVMVNIPLTPWSQIELMADFQNSNFKGGDDIFVPDQNLGDVDVAYYHVGFVFQGDHPRVQPFGVFSLGATNISPDLEGLDSETKFSTSFGGGVKVFFSKNVGLRLEGRGFYTVLDTENDDFCDNYCYEYTDDMWQGEVRAGLIMRF
ncbi:MAG: porin family protein [Acidobacteria bacterium]|nr:porin family protein [Acidobacteriota bacterium]